MLALCSLMRLAQKCNVYRVNLNKLTVIGLFLHGVYWVKTISTLKARISAASVEPLNRGRTNKEIPLGQRGAFAECLISRRIRLEERAEGSASFQRCEIHRELLHIHLYMCVSLLSNARLACTWIKTLSFIPFALKLCADRFMMSYRYPYQYRNNGYRIFLLIVGRTLN